MNLKSMMVKLAAVVALAGAALVAAPAAEARSSWGITISGGDPYYGLGYGLSYYDDDYYYPRRYAPVYYAPYRPYYRPVYRSYYRPVYRSHYRPYYRSYYRDRHYRGHRYDRRYRRW